MICNLLSQPTQDSFGKFEIPKLGNLRVSLKSDSTIGILQSSSKRPYQEDRTMASGFLLANLPRLEEEWIKISDLNGRFKRLMVVAPKEIQFKIVFEERTRDLSNQKEDEFEDKKTLNRSGRKDDEELQKGGPNKNWKSTTDGLKEQMDGSDLHPTESNPRYQKLSTEQVKFIGLPMKVWVWPKAVGDEARAQNCIGSMPICVTEQIWGLPGSPIHRWSYQLPFINHFETIHTGPLVSLISHGGLSVGLSLMDSL
ncbi:hypothetical protein PPACK8108_LOCUS25943 [Phakopsora pachyrhizi]|uniref:Uncharacterized protein n=1 Tax=Phakopsora pachyrhizi TaxID=170000 RepID=A0AAV0BT00_PHAPC|nr:hypothetical protein PPACK8108_LOCUS25943 [Phakopsora pachyrhizi]